MDFSSSVKRKNKIRSRIKIEGEYENRLQLYIYPPTDDITLEEFEKLAVTRQKCKMTDLTLRIIKLSLCNFYSAKRNQ